MPSDYFEDIDEKVKTLEEDYCFYKDFYLQFRNALDERSIYFVEILQILIRNMIMLLLLEINM